MSQHHLQIRVGRKCIVIGHLVVIISGLLVNLVFLCQVLLIEFVFVILTPCHDFLLLEQMFGHIQLGQELLLKRVDFVVVSFSQQLLLLQGSVINLYLRKSKD